MRQGFYQKTLVLSATTLDRIAILAKRLRVNDNDLVRMAIESFDPPAPVIPEPEPPTPRVGRLSDIMAAALFTTYPNDERK